MIKKWIILMCLVHVCAAQTADLPDAVYLIPNFHPACCGWLTDWSTERNYCANTYLDHLDRVRDDANYSFALSEVPNMIAILNFHPDRMHELKQRIREGRVELCNAFFLEPTINLSGGEALVKNGIEGLRWQTQVLGFRPRFSWMIDVTGTHEQMAQITKGLGLDALFYTRHNPTGYSVHWIQSPDGSKVIAVSPGHYSDWNPLFKTIKPLNDKELADMLDDVVFRANRTALTTEEIEKRRNIWSGTPCRAPIGVPVLVLGGSGDYSVAPLRKEYPTEFLQQFKKIAPQTDFYFSTPARFVDVVLPGIRSGVIKLATMTGSTAFSFNAFWIENPRVKQSFRRLEQQLQAAEMIATIASLKSTYHYPVQPLYHGWLMMLLNMDRNSLWGSAGGIVFESEKSWDVADRYQAVDTLSQKVLQDAVKSWMPPGTEVALFNSLNWQRSDPLLISLPPNSSLKKFECQSIPGTDMVLCAPSIPSMGVAVLEVAPKLSKEPKKVLLPKTIKTKYFQAGIDPHTGALVSLKMMGSGIEMLGGPANVIVAEIPKMQNGDPGDHIVDRQFREMAANSSQFKSTIKVTKGALATTVEIVSDFFGGGVLVRTVRFYNDYPRIDFVTELNDIPDRTVVVAEFPLAKEITEVRRGIPYGFSHGTWENNNSQLRGWTKGIVPAVRWSHYTLTNGCGVALLDRGLSGRELTGKTPIIFLLNATDKYYGYPNSWLSGKGKHRLEYALVAHESVWEKARIPQMAWEYNNPVYPITHIADASSQSFVTTSENIIIEAMRREGEEVEIRFAECVGQIGLAEIKINLPHQQARRTDMTGKTIEELLPTSAYHFPVQPQQIVTMRFRTNQSVAEIKPLTDWNPLTPLVKREALNTFVDKKGHPPRGDVK